MTDIKRPRVYLDVSIAGDAAGRLTIELFTDKTPKTCENFRQLCTSPNPSLNYTQTPIHRIIDTFMIQGGDIPHGDGTGITSIYNNNKDFEDENLDWRELDERGLVCSANHGPDTNGSQFFVLLEGAPHLNGLHTCFGRLVGGEEVLRRLGKVEVDGEDRPREAVVVMRCGELERRSKAPAANLEQPNGGKDRVVVEDEGSRDSSARGRKRKSNDSAQAVHDAPEAARKRRQSDNVLDEGLRGRPKQRSRSHSRSNSEAIEEEDSGSQEGGPVRHKRKRSPSPSRHMDRREQRDNSGEDDRDRRRRKSLPNQYHNERDQRQGRRGQDSYRPGGRRDDDRYGGGDRYDGDRNGVGDRNGNWVRDGGRGGHGADSRGPRDYQGYRDRGPRYDRRPRQNYDEGRLGQVDEGKLGGPRDDGRGDDEPAVTYKGRGAMKYRER